MQRTVFSCFFQHLHIHSFYTASDHIPRRKALLIGVRDVPNLFSREMNVPGAHKDTKRFRNLLIRKYRYKEEDIVVMKDDPDMSEDERERLWPTRKNIMREMDTLVKDASPGDHFVFMYSGHGGQIVALDDTAEKDGLDEILFATDSDIDPNSSSGVPLVNYIKDDEIRTTLMRLPASASCVMIFDCWNRSGVPKLFRTSYMSMLEPMRHVALPSSSLGFARMQTIHPTDAEPPSGPPTMRFELGRYAIPSTAFGPLGPNLTSWSACKDENSTIGNSRGGIFLRAFCQALYNDPTPTHAKLLRTLSEDIDRVIDQVPQKYKQGLEDIPIPQLGSSRPSTVLDTRFTL
ncbi:peptidase C14 [Lenzites betulinus]|nr:peptidase C14 [Lenzites betulinus]